LALGDSLFNHAHQLPRRVSTLNVPAELDLLTLREHRALMEADYIVAPEATPAALLEMARRDAVRLLPHQIDSLDHATGNILHISLTHPAQVPFPVREDLQEAILRAAS